MNAPKQCVPHAAIREEIAPLRLAASSYLVTRHDTIVIASVSCIYGLGSADAYKSMMVPLAVRQILAIGGKNGTLTVG